MLDDGLGRDLADRVGLEARGAVAVAERRGLRELDVSLGLVHAGGRALEERGDALATVHELRHALHVCGEVGLPVVAARDREVQHVVEVVGDLVEVRGAEVDAHRRCSGRLELGALLLVREACTAEDGVVARERAREGAAGHPGGAGDEDALTREWFDVRHGDLTLGSFGAS